MGTCRPEAAEDLGKTGNNIADQVYHKFLS